LRENDQSVLLKGSNKTKHRTAIRESRVDIGLDKFPRRFVLELIIVPHDSIEGVQKTILQSTRGQHGQEVDYWGFSFYNIDPILVVGLRGATSIERQCGTRF
jgi:phosphoribosyl 1,2-cyclic phosphodiesterase